MVELEPTPLAGLVVARHIPVGDDRGELERLFCEADMRDAVGDRRIVQINLTRTNAVGAVRGMHYQMPPFAEMKIVTCVRGRVLDVAVDLRAGSPSFLQHHAVELNPSSHRTLVIPEGFAHGFQVLETDSEVLYLSTAPYHPEAERGFSATEPLIGIEWPLPISQMSDRDRTHDLLDRAFQGVSL